MRQLTLCCALVALVAGCGTVGEGGEILTPEIRMQIAAAATGILGSLQEMLVAAPNAPIGDVVGNWWSQNRNVLGAWGVGLVSQVVLGLLAGSPQDIADALPPRAEDPSVVGTRGMDPRVGQWLATQTVARTRR